MARPEFLNVEILGAPRVLASALPGEEAAARILLDLGISSHSDFAISGVFAGHDALYVLTIDVFEAPHVRALCAYSYAWLLAGGDPDPEQLDGHEFKRLRRDGSIRLLGWESPDEELDFGFLLVEAEAACPVDPEGAPFRALFARLSSGRVVSGGRERDFLLGAPAEPTAPTAQLVPSGSWSGNGRRSALETAP